MCFSIAHIKADIISIRLDAQKHLQIESQIISLTNNDLRPKLKRLVLGDLGAKSWPWVQQ